MISIPLTRGMSAKIDDEDLPLVEGYKWRAIKGWNDCWYAMAHTPVVNGQRISIQMHRLILGVPKGIQVDHRNGDGLDNQRLNIRPATSQQNGQNSRKTENKKSSKYKGVSLDKRHKTWKAYITVNKSLRWLGYFPTEELAAAAYDTAALAEFGQFARLNFRKKG